MANDYLSLKEFRESTGMDDWPVLADGATTFFRTDTVAASARLVQAIADLDGVEEHRPDLDVRADGVTVRLLTMASDIWGSRWRARSPQRRRASGSRPTPRQCRASTRSSWAPSISSV
jgi:4a-hydroxytetrahydrobiopterin dehydratase